MTIKHIVITGGGPSGLVSYGVLKHLNNEGFWSLSNIQTIHASSVGGIISTILLLDYKWDWLDDYFIKRPWEKILDEFMSVDLLTILSNKGLDSKVFINYILEPLFNAKDINLNISLKDFHKLTNVDLYLYATNLNNNFDLSANVSSSMSITSCVINKNTYPNMRLIDAVASTMAFPFIFKPIFVDDKCLIDGGVLNNFPLNMCMKTNCNIDEILAIKNMYNVSDNITQDTPIIDFMRLFFTKVHNTLDHNSHTFTNIPFLVECCVDNLSKFELWIKALNNHEYRDYLIKSGVSSGISFMKKIIVKN
jgi:NTE family protein